jgi:hypothetical protein
MRPVIEEAVKQSSIDQNEMMEKYKDMTQTHEKCFCDVHDSCGLHADKTPKEKFDERLKDLKCVNGAMYFGSVEDDSCNCKTSCQNSQTFDHAFEELSTFFHTEWNTMVEGVIAEIDTNLKNNSDYNKGMCDAQNIIRRHLLK